MSGSKFYRTLTVTGNAPTPTTPPNDVQGDFEAFQLRPVIRDFKLSAELFASNGENVLICGKGNQDKQGMLLVSYHIPTTGVTLAGNIRLVKLVKLAKKTVTQLETIPSLKIALLLGDAIVTILDIDTLGELMTVSNNAILFATCYEIPPTPSTPTTPSNFSITTSMSLSASSRSDSSGSASNEVRICVASKRRTLSFYRWTPQDKKAQEEKNLSGFELFDIPKALGFSNDRICIGYKKSYVIMNLTDGKILSELPFNMAHDPVINCFQDRTQWCIQLEANTVFLNANFEPLYENGIPWKDIPSAVVQSSPYVLALTNPSIDICTFNGSQAVPVQQIPHKSPGAAGKCRLWMDSQSQRIYSATPTDVVLLEPIPVHIQLQNYTGMYKYDLALILIRAMLGISVTASVGDDHSRTKDGHAKGINDISSLPKVMTFENNETNLSKPKSEDSTVQRNSMLESSIQGWTNSITRNSQIIDNAALWVEYYRVGTMYSFQIFHKQQFEQAFAEFNEFLTDPTDIICLFSQLSPQIWLSNPHKDLTGFLKTHPHFAEPNDFVGAKLETALRELQPYLTDLRGAFQKLYRRSPDAWLEVQSLVRGSLILKPVRDLLVVVETALLKAYLLVNNNILANALLRNPDNCCLPSEVEKELTKHNLRRELVSFYERQKRHREALQLINNTEALASNDNIVEYLTKLGNDDIQLIFEYVKPLIQTALEGERDEDLLHEIMILFIGEPTPISPSTFETPNVKTIKLDPIAVHDFLQSINEDFGVKYLESIRFKSELGPKQREIHNRLVFAYCDRLKELAQKIQRPNKDSSPDEDNRTSQTPNELSLKKQLSDYETKLKTFLLDSSCQCDFDRLEAYFLQAQTDTFKQRLFSLHYAIVLGKLGRHHGALETFLKNGFYTDAEQYCETIHSTGNQSLARELYGKLILHYLQQGNDGLKNVLRIINFHSERLDPVEILKTLPGQLKLSNMIDFLGLSLQTSSTKKRSSQLERNLLFSKLLRTQSKRIDSENHSFTIDGDTRCGRRECTQPFNATQAVVRFPDNNIVHLHCRAKYESEQEKSNKKR